MISDNIGLFVYNKYISFNKALVNQGSIVYSDKMDLFSPCIATVTKCAAIFVLYAYP